MTFEEVRKLTGMTRRVIQEYEDAGLAKRPLAKNKYGHLEYNDEDVEHLFVIRMYRELKYNKKQIKEALKSKCTRKDNLDKQIEELKSQREELDRLINLATAMRETGLSPSKLRTGIPCLNNSSFSDISRMIGSLLYIDEVNVEPIFRDEESEKLYLQILEKKIIELGHYFANQLECDDHEVQEVISEVHDIVSRYITKSIDAFAIFSLNIKENPNFKEIWGDVDNHFGIGFVDYFYNSIRVYCYRNDGDEYDNKIIVILKFILKLGKQKKKCNSKDVQLKVEELFEILGLYKVYTKASVSEYIKQLIVYMKKLDYDKKIDLKYGEKAFRYLQESIEIYLSNNS